MKASLQVCRNNFSSCMYICILLKSFITMVLKYIHTYKTSLKYRGVEHTVCRIYLTTKIHCQTNLIRLSQCCQSHYFLSKASFNSCKMEYLIYKGGCGIHVSRCLKESWLGLQINNFSLPFATTLCRQTHIHCGRKQSLKKLGWYVWLIKWQQGLITTRRSKEARLKSPASVCPKAIIK